MRDKRKGISPKTRFEVFKRDGFTCAYCGGHPPKVLLHVDHITAVAKGGTNDIDNLTTACVTCNLGKGARDLRVVPESLADKAKQVAEREAQLKGYQDILSSKRERLESEMWQVANTLFEDCREVGLRRDWGVSITRFIEELGLHEVLRACDIALSKGTSSDYALFKYFCGVCWKLVRGEEYARA